MPHPPVEVPSLRSLLDETLDLEPPQREAFLAGLRASHPERAVELEVLTCRSISTS
jgi:hypothetical protein